MSAAVRLEGGVAGLVGVAGRGRVGDAPVDAPRVVGELGADLADLVAQGDHVVEPAAGEGVQVAGALAGDVDAVARRAAPGRRRGAGRGLGRLPALVTSTWPPVWWRSRASAIGERALLPVHTNSTATAGAGPPPGSGWWRLGAQRGVQRGAGVGQRVGAAVQVQVVVAVAAVEAAAAWR